MAVSVATKAIAALVLVAVGGMIVTNLREPRHELHLSMIWSSIIHEDPELRITVNVNGTSVVRQKTKNSPWGKTIKVDLPSVVVLTGEAMGLPLAMECHIFDNNGNVLDENIIWNSPTLECKASLL